MHVTLILHRMRWSHIFLAVLLNFRNAYDSAKKGSNGNTSGSAVIFVDLTSSTEITTLSYSEFLYTSGHTWTDSLWGMHEETTMRRIMTISAVLLLLCFPSTAAQADGDEVPENVADVFSTDMLEDMHDNGSSVMLGKNPGTFANPVDYGDVVGFGTIHEVFVWSHAFIFDGDPTSAPEPYEFWIAPALLNNGDAAGTATVRWPSPEGVARVSGYDNDVELGNALKKVPDGAQLITDYTINAWYAVKDGTVTAVNTAAATEVPQPMPIEEFQPIIATRWAERIAASEGVFGGAGGGGGGNGASWWHQNQATIYRSVGIVALLGALTVAGYLVRSIRHDKKRAH